MTFDEWIEKLERTQGGFPNGIRSYMQWAWDAAIECGKWTTFNPKPADDDGCKPFDSQEEIAKLREEFKEIRAFLEMRVSPPLILDVNPPIGREWGTYEATIDFEPEVAAGEGFNLYFGDKKVTDFHNWRNSKESKPADWAIDGLPVDHPERTKRVNERNSQAADLLARISELKADGMEGRDAVKQALDERHGRKPAEPNFPGY